jgi:hypothetical protein
LDYWHYSLLECSEDQDYWPLWRETYSKRLLPHWKPIIWKKKKQQKRKNERKKRKKRVTNKRMTIISKRRLPELNRNIQEVEIIDNGPGVPVHHHRLPQIGFNRLIPGSESRGKDSRKGRKR